MEKVDRSASNVWRSLLQGEFEANPFVLDQMQQKSTLERFQREVRELLLLESLQHFVKT